MGATGGVSDVHAKDDLQIGGWLVRPSLNEISRYGVTRRLRSQLMDLLVLLAERAGKVISKDEILEEVWQGRFVTESVLPRCVAELRELLGDEVGCCTFIETIPKRGYRLIAPVADHTDLPARTRQPSVLVLPFRDLSEKQDQQYFCAGLCEQIINSLTGVAGLRVIARSSAFLLDKDVSDLSRLGARIHVDKILEGSVRKAQRRIRITVELTDTASQCFVWSESYEGRIGSIFELQDRITQAVITQMKVELLDREKDRVTKRPTNNLEAHTWYLKGLYHWNQRTREGFILSRQCFEAAIQNDPSYTLPYVALANSYSIAAFYGFARPDKCFPEAKRLVGRALAIDPNFAEAHASLAFITYLYDWDWPAWESSFKRALALNPNYSTTYVWYALCLSWQDQPIEANATLERGFLADPLSALLATARGVLLYQQEQFKPAQHQFRQALQIDADYSLAHLHLARALAADGKYRESISHARRALSLGQPMVRGLIALGYARTGQTAACKKVLGELLRQSQVDYVPPIAFVYAYTGLQDLENARRWISEACKLHDPILRLLPTDPLLRDLRSAPEIRRLRTAPKSSRTQIPK